ncbi:hypothetical protein [Hwangdonia seohaensis]|uniref:Uncharacterized protein n=1 Tax=Hwangdonia seohaensis TaxID=1240727 RepID=A0ABW3R8L7_9FLAO|nr:hypothetical protein [Hwangdonia seohaensis]
MGKYKIGKDIGELTVRLQHVEEKVAYARNNGQSGNTSNSACKCRGVSDSELYESLEDAAPDSKVFEILKNLMIDAGEVTIRELFACTIEDVGHKAANAIALAKEIGFLALSNDKCCHEVDDVLQNDYCKSKTGKWCSLVKKHGRKRCTLASDKC